MMGTGTRIPDFVRSTLSKFPKVNILLYVALLTVGGAVVLAGVHAGVTGSSVPLSSASGKSLDSESGSDSLSVASSPTVASLPSVADSSPMPRSSHVAGSPGVSATPSPTVGSSAAAGTSRVASFAPLAGGDYAGSLILDDTGSQLIPWNQTSSFCATKSWEIPDGIVSTNSIGDATLKTTGTPGSCVALISPAAYSSGVIETSIDFPALPSDPNTIANWTSFWLTDTQAGTWPMAGELDAAEVEPDAGVSAVTYHWGTTASPLRISTSGPPGDVLPVEGPNLTPGWHVVDLVYTSGYFAVYYDGILYTSYSSSVITGDALNVVISAAVTPDTSTIEQELDGPPINSDSSPATVAVKYVRVWSYK
jgi:hypothetical protein